jgi:hypothetical protein
MDDFSCLRSQRSEEDEVLAVLTDHRLVEEDRRRKSGDGPEPSVRKACLWNLEPRSISLVRRPQPPSERPISVKSSVVYLSYRAKNNNPRAPADRPSDGIQLWTVTNYGCGHGGVAVVRLNSRFFIRGIV